MPSREGQEAVEDVGIQPGRQVVEILEQLGSRLVLHRAGLDPAKVAGDAPVGGAQAREEPPLIRIELGVADLSDLSDVVPGAEPFGRPHKLARQGGVVEPGHVVEAEVAQRVVPVVAVDEEERASGHGRSPTGRTANKNPGVWREPDTGGIKPEFPWVLGVKCNLCQDPSLSSA
jgi:hypothetical protein